MDVPIDNLPNIYVIHGDMTQQQLNELYNHTKVKAMITFTHGEGFGRPLLEFSVTGKPVIYSNWSGHVDFLSEHCIPLAGELKPVHQSVLQEHMIVEGSHWFYTDYGYAIGAIKDVYTNYKKHLEKSRKQTKYVKDNFSLDKMTELFRYLVELNVPTQPVKQPNVMSKEDLLSLQHQE